MPWEERLARCPLLTGARGPPLDIWLRGRRRRQSCAFVPIGAESAVASLVVHSPCRSSLQSYLPGYNEALQACVTSRSRRPDDHGAAGAGRRPPKRENSMNRAPVTAAFEPRCWSDGRFRERGVV